MNDRETEPFERDELVDKPGIAGARWWHRGIVEAQSAMNRRKALGAILVAGGALAGLALLLGRCGSSGEDHRIDKKSSLDMQREFGWSFGAATESLTFDGESKKPFDRAALARMPTEMRPTRPDLVPYFVPTLFQSPAAVPRTLPAGESAAVMPLSDALRPIFTPAMDLAYRRGRALASLLARVPDVAVVVDLKGPEAVAFAAGSASVFDPVFAFDNWPHPRGVVPAHLALAAAAYYQPLFARGARSERPAMFVLDRSRLTPYTDDASQFDNRHLARLPSASALKALGVRRVLYVVPTELDTRELDDLNDEFLLDTGAGLDVKMVAANAFAPDPAETSPVSESPDEGPPYYYGGQKATHLWFWTDYPWIPPPLPVAKAPTIPTPGKSYAPAARATDYSSGTRGGSALRPKPATFGTVPVVVAIATGVILGAVISRSGSWNRSFGGLGG